MCVCAVYVHMCAVYYGCVSVNVLIACVNACMCVCVHVLMLVCYACVDVMLVLVC